MFSHRTCVSAWRRTAFAALLLTSLAAPATLGIDTAKSKFTATFRQMNVPVDGEFTKASGTIVFDAQHLDSAQADIRIDTASFDLGMDDYNAEVRKKEWFDSKTYPQAFFVSKRISALGANRYEVSGTLTIKGKSQPVTLPISVKTEAAATIFTGTMPVSRQAFAIGDASWNEMVEDAVLVSFRIVQPR